MAARTTTSRRQTRTTCSPSPTIRSGCRYIPLPATCFNEKLGRSELILVRRCSGTEGAARLLHQVGLDEAVEIAVEHAVHVADLELRAVVLDHLIGLQHVASDLVAEGDVALLPAELFELGLLFLR